MPAMPAMSEHQAQLKIEEWQARYFVMLVSAPNAATLDLQPYEYDCPACGYCHVSTTVRIDLRLIDLVRQMQEKLAEAQLADAATIDKSTARE